MASKHNGHSYHRPSTSVTATPEADYWKLHTASEPFLRRPQSRLSLQYQPDGRMRREDSADGLQDLATFFWTKEPPPSNWVSNPADDHKGIRSLRKSASKIFRRHNSNKKSRTSELLQLPDSAVSARTRSGVRHIAISIPVDYDLPEKPPVPDERPSVPRPQRIISENGTVTVLKPVLEAKESRLSYPQSAQATQTKRPPNLSRSRSLASHRQAADAQDSETTSRLGNDYGQPRQQREALNNCSDDKANVATDGSQRPDSSTYGDSASGNTTVTSTLLSRHTELSTQQSARPFSAPLLHFSSQSTLASNAASDTKDMADLTPVTSKDEQQSRRDRVKAKKWRDIDSCLAQRSSTSLRNAAAAAATTKEGELSPRRAPSTKGERQSLRSAVSIIPIMIVADLQPIPEHHPLPSPDTRQHTPPHQHLPAPPPPTSPSARSDADSEAETVTSSSGRSFHSTSTLTQRSATGSLAPSSTAGSELRARREGRRAQRNRGAREREIESRLAVMERDNRVLMATLSGLVKGIEGLQTLKAGERGVVRC